MNNKIGTVFLLFLTISVSVNVYAQETKSPPAKVTADPPFLITSFNQLAVDLKKPEFPKVARDTDVTGRVEVWIEVDRNGNVIKARPVSGRAAKGSIGGCRASK